MSWNLTTSGAAISKAGVGANSAVIISGSILAKWSDQAEASLSAITRKDWVADYSSVGTNFKGILDDVCSDMIAIKIVNYDTSGYMSRIDSQIVLDVIRDNLSRNLEILKEQKNQEVMD